MLYPSGLTATSPQEGRSFGTAPKNELPLKNELQYFVKHYAGADELQAGAAEEAEEGADAGLERGPDAFVLNEELAQKSAQQGPQDYTYRREKPDDQTDYGSGARSLVAPRDLGEPGRDEVVEHRHGRHHGQPDEEELRGHRVGHAGPAGEVDEKQPHPAEGRAWKAGNYTPDDSDKAKNYGQNAPDVHSEKSFIQLSQVLFTVLPARKAVFQMKRPSHIFLSTLPHPEGAKKQILRQVNLPQNDTKLSF